ncbi:unnamed protein product [Nezara viridula]|uniref:Centrosomal protein of 97 kDa n=1 Tax=Nezara viridula TaxID=85310 RepID=A0A9P0E684_NEZVI|nr:unnamed protein product [Nezara viridula]
MDFIDEEKVLNLCNQHIKRLNRNFISKEKAANISYLHLDGNELQKLEFLAFFTNLVQFSASQNQLLRMYNIAPLKTLVSVDLSYNKIITIEGLKDLIHLTSLNLSHNKIKEIDHLYSNVALEYLDLSDNLIGCLSNISHLSKLKKLYLHKNMITQLRHAEVYLPKSIDTLTLAHNKIADLNEFSRLAGIINLREISLKSNPCVEMTGQMVGFDYRPFLVNWCLELQVIDGYAVDELESLRGEWLYSQGKGRQFRPGEHAQLVQYLAENLPFNNEPLQSEQERKLRLILSKAQQHQSQLMTESLTGGKSSSSQLMSRSLDPSSLQGYKEKSSPPMRILSQSLHCPSTSSHVEEETKLEEITAPLPAASKLVPVPESLISPMVSNIPDIASSSNSKANATSSDYYICEDLSSMKLHTIKTKVDEIRSKKSNSDRDQAATCIQKNWRGYLSRNSNSSVQTFYQQLQVRRVNGHIAKLSEEVRSLKTALENEHKLHVLQMQAINALWRKVQQLQVCMQEVLRAFAPSTSSSSSEVSTQTDIVAVHTPDDTGFLYHRPSTLPLTTHPVSRFVENLVGDVFKDTIEEENSEEQ